jgi:Thioredoxin-like/SPOR domain
MNKMSLVLGGLWCILFCTSRLTVHADVQFLHLSLAEAKNQAAQLQKPALLYFSANWCMPCHWMEENVFADRELSQFLNQQYLPVKIDVDEVQGYADKESCQVQYLPSLLLVSPQGQIVGRFESTRNAQELIRNLVDARIHPPTSSTAPNVVVRNSINIAVPGGLGKNASQPVKIANNNSYPDHNLVNGGSSVPPVARQGTFLPRGVQFGIYSNYETVVKQVQFLEQKFGRTVNINAQIQDGKTFYQLAAGPFESPDQLQNYLGALQKEGLKWLLFEWK